MKVGDVEYQGDKTKAIFYYLADDRVDFRELIKYMADTFKIRIEMRQIGARQEAGRIGGIGSLRTRIVLRNLADQFCDRNHHQFSPVIRSCPSIRKSLRGSAENSNVA
jgi:cell fate regulator YaaT (PSP1 superfamily)